MLKAIEAMRQICGVVVSIFLTKSVAKFAYCCFCLHFLLSVTQFECPANAVLWSHLCRIDSSYICLDNEYARIYNRNEDFLCICINDFA